MEGCLLCLEINKEFVDCIKVDSTKWQQLNIKNLIEKYLWVMDTVLPSSWLCCTCWQALYDFHKFYIRIEEAHMDFGKLMKTEIEPETKDKSIPTDEYKNDKENNDLFEPQILIDPLVMDDQKEFGELLKTEFNYNKSIIKEEICEDHCKDNLPLMKRPKRSCNSKGLVNNKEKINNTLNNTNESELFSKRKNSNSKKVSSIQLKPPTETILENSEILIQHMKEDPDTLETPDVYINSPISSFCDSFTDNDCKPEDDSKRCKKITKRKYKLKRNSLDSDAFNTDCDDKSQEEVAKLHKQNSKQKDQFLAENFKMCCVLCQIPMSNFKTLIKHFEIEHKEHGFAVCCNKKFDKRSKLLEHVQRHVDPSNFKCDKCGKELSSQLSLKNHQLVHVSAEEKKFACNECDKTYAERNKLTIHINRVHLRKYVKICDICGKRLRCGEAFQRHMLEHEGKSLPNISCDVCGLLVTTKHGLRRHKTMQHPVNGKKEYSCNICFKVSPNIYALRKHINCTHSADNHKCTMCGRGFKRPLALREHMATHTGIALYTCPWCPKTFNASGGMHAHRKTQHPIEWEESRRQKNLDKYKNTASTSLHVQISN